MSLYLQRALSGKTQQHYDTVFNMVLQEILLKVLRNTRRTRDGENRDDIKNHIYVRKSLGGGGGGAGPACVHLWALA